MTVTGEQILAFAIKSYDGLPYVLGAEADIDPEGGFDDPTALDCSELIQVSCTRMGINMPDGHWNQWRVCRDAGTLIPVDQAIATPGALLFHYDGTTEGHVGFSRGDGTTFEARGRAWGTGSWSAYRGDFFNYGALIPGVLYPNPDYQPEDEDDMAFTAEELAKAIVKEFMEYPIPLEDGKTHQMQNVIGYGNNIGNATVAALQQLEEPEQVAKRRGKSVEEVAPAALLRARKEAAHA